MGKSWIAGKRKSGSDVQASPSSQRIGLIAFLLLTGACQGSSRSPSVPVAAAAPTVRIDEEPRHRLVYQNHYTRVFDLVIPPGDTTRFHVHAAPTGVVIQDGRNWTQTLGALPGPVKAGATSGTILENWAVTLPYAHRVGNADVVAIHYIFGEWLASSGIDVPTLGGTRQMVKEGAVARVYRIVLAPGESTEMHRHASPGLSVQVTAGAVSEEGAAPAAFGGSGAGAWRWRDPGHRHLLRNTGAAPAQVVEIDWR